MKAFYLYAFHESHKKNQEGGGYFRDTIRVHLLASYGLTSFCTSDMGLFAPHSSQWCSYAFAEPLVMHVASFFLTFSWNSYHLLDHSWSQGLPILLIRTSYRQFSNF